MTRRTKNAYAAKPSKARVAKLGRAKKIGPANVQTSVIAAKQRTGGPDHGGMPPRRGFPSLPMESGE